MKKYCNVQPTPHEKVDTLTTKSKVIARQHHTMGPTKKMVFRILPPSKVDESLVHCIGVQEDGTNKMHWSPLFVVRTTHEDLLQKNNGKVRTPYHSSLIFKTLNTPQSENAPRRRLLGPGNLEVQMKRWPRGPELPAQAI